MLLIASEHKAEIEPLLKLYPFVKKSNLFKYDNLAVFVNYAKGALPLSYGIVDILSKNEDINIAVLFGFSGAVNERLKVGDLFTLNKVKLIHNRKPIFNPVDMPSIKELPAFCGVSLLSGYEKDNRFLDLFADSVDKESYFFAKAIKSIGKFGIIIRVISDDNTDISIRELKTGNFSCDVEKLKNIIDRLAFIEKDEVLLEIFRYTGISDLKTLLGLKKLIALKRFTFSNRQKLYKKILINSKKEELRNPKFSVFVEKGVDKKRIRLGINKNNIFEIDDYVGYFHNLKNQRGIFFASKKGEFLRKTPNYYTPNNSYGYSILNAYNCIYDCSYCFLKGYFKSFNPVIFLNYEDYFAAIKDVAKNDKMRPLYFYSGTFSDSLAMDNFSDFNERLVEFFKNEIDDDIFLEIRTKSDRVYKLSKINPGKNIIVAFSVNPQSIIDRFEHLTPSLDMRFKAIEKLDKAGYKIGIRLDPVFAENLEDYDELLKKIKAVKNLHSVEVGFLRYDKNDYSTTFKKNPCILRNLIYENGMYRYKKDIRSKAIEYFKLNLKRFYLSME